MEEIKTLTLEKIKAIQRESEVRVPAEVLGLEVGSVDCQFKSLALRLADVGVDLIYLIEGKQCAFAQ